MAPFMPKLTLQIGCPHTSSAATVALPSSSECIEFTEYVLKSE